MVDVVIICCDCLRYDYVTAEHMPGLTELAKDGVFFTNCFSGGGDTKNSLPYFLSSQTQYDKERNLASVLKKRGYSTAMIHTSNVLDDYSAGFDKCVDIHRTLTQSAAWKVRSILGKKWWNRVRSLHKMIIGNKKAAEKLRDRATVRAILLFQSCLDWMDMIDGNKFLWAHPMDPHIPYSPVMSSLRLSDERISELNRKILDSVFKGYTITEDEDRDIKSLYADEVKYLDRELSQFIQKLSDAIVVVSADHGDELGEYGFYSHGSYEHHGLIPQLIHVPLIFLGEGVKSVIIDKDVSTMDIAPTILDIVGIEDRFGYGSSLKGLMGGELRYE